MEKNRTEQIEKYYPNLICTQSLGHVRNLLSSLSVWYPNNFIFILWILLLTFCFSTKINALNICFQMAITSERLHKQSVIIKQICKLFPQRRVLLIIFIYCYFSFRLFMIHFSAFCLRSSVVSVLSNITLFMSSYGLYYDRHSRHPF